MKTRVTHLIPGLGKGGAETMLYQVLRYGSDEGLISRVVTFGTAHYYEEPLRALGIEVTELPLRRRPIHTAIQLLRIARHTDTLCCWMYHCNMIGYLVGRLAGVPRIVWNIRHSSLEKEITKERTLKISRWCAKRSNRVAAIAYNGELARAVHEAAGYCREKGVVLDNGCDCEEYRPDATAGTRLRTELGIPETVKIILSVTRDHPIKDVPTFLQAFALLHHQLPQTTAVMCGAGIEAGNGRLTALCRENGLTPGREIFLLGRRDDVPQLLAACDLYVLHSASEAFPNALLQAMACGALCVTTDVGDARRIISDDTAVVPPQNAAALTEKMQAFLAFQPKQAAETAQKNRLTAQQRYEIRRVVKAYEKIENDHSDR